MRGNSTGPPCSAAFVRSSAAVRTAGEARSAAGTVLTRCTIAWRNVASLAPSLSTIGSAKRWDHTRRNSATEPGFKLGDGESFRRKKPRTTPGAGVLSGLAARIAGTSMCGCDAQN